MAEIEIKEVPFSEILPWRRAAAKDRVVLKEWPGERWFAAFKSGDIVGFGGMTITKGRAKMRSDWVQPTHRSQGVASALIDRRVEECRGRASVVEAFAYDPLRYVRRGFRVVGGPTTAGATRVVLQLAIKAKVMNGRTSAQA